LSAGKTTCSSCTSEMISQGTRSIDHFERNSQLPIYMPIAHTLPIVYSGPTITHSVGTNILSLIVHVCLLVYDRICGVSPPTRLSCNRKKAARALLLVMLRIPPWLAADPSRPSRPTLHQLYQPQSPIGCNVQVNYTISHALRTKARPNMPQKIAYALTKSLACSKI
jgi:hypothetical protein